MAASTASTSRARRRRRRRPYSVRIASRTSSDISTPPARSSVTIAWSSGPRRTFKSLVRRRERIPDRIIKTDCLYVNAWREASTVVRTEKPGAGHHVPASGTRLREEVDLASRPAESSRLVDRPRCDRVLEFEPAAAVHRELLGGGAAWVGTAQHLAQLGPYRIGSETDPAERAHLDGERAVVAHEQCRANHLGAHLRLAR